MLYCCQTFSALWCDRFLL